MTRRDDAIPDPIRKRDLVYGPPVHGENPAALGDRFREVGRLPEALEFYLRAADRTRVQGLLQQAVEQGDAFLVERVAAALPDLVDADLRRRAAHHAEQCGKWRFAANLYERAGDVERAAEVRTRFTPPTAAAASPSEAVEPLDT